MERVRLRIYIDNGIIGDDSGEMVKDNTSIPEQTPLPSEQQAPVPVKPALQLEQIKYVAERENFFAKKRGDRQKGLCILIVDDHLFSRQLLVEALRLKWNYETIATKNGSQAIEAYLENAPEIVFLDIELPDYNGQEVLRKIKEIDKNSFVVMTTSNTATEEVKTAIEGGASGFIAKPITKSKLEQYFAVFLERLQKN